jgi:guanylate kinase
MTPYELELVAIAKNRGDSVTRQLAEILQKQQAEIEELKEALSVKVILNEHAQQSMKEVKGLLRKAQEK